MINRRSQPYQERFPVGSVIRVADAGVLDRFFRTWLWHHPLEPEQLRFAGTLAEVKSVGFYHGGDVLYELKNIPGTWHEGCLEPAENSDGV